MIKPTKKDIMLLLTVYKEPAGKKEKREFARLQEAIEFGQRTGSDYEIYDPATGKVIDWNEINVKEEEEWYYDEHEFLWKRFRPTDDFEDGYAAGEFHGKKISQKRNLRCA
jgi:hypothetical protein